MEIPGTSYYSQKIAELLKDMSLENIKRIYNLAIRLWKKEAEPSVDT